MKATVFKSFSQVETLWREMVAKLGGSNATEWDYDLNLKLYHHSVFGWDKVKQSNEYVHITDCHIVVVEEHDEVVGIYPFAKYAGTNERVQKWSYAFCPLNSFWLFFTKPLALPGVTGRALKFFPNVLIDGFRHTVTPELLGMSEGLVQIKANIVDLSVPDYFASLKSRHRSELKNLMERNKDVEIRTDYQVDLLWDALVPKYIQQWEERNWPIDCVISGFKIVVDWYARNNRLVQTSLYLDGKPVSVNFLGADDDIASDYINLRDTHLPKERAIGNYTCLQAILQSQKMGLNWYDFSAEVDSGQYKSKFVNTNLFCQSFGVWDDPKTFPKDAYPPFYIPSEDRWQH